MKILVLIMTIMKAMFLSSQPVSQPVFDFDVLAENFLGDIGKTYDAYHEGVHRIEKRTYAFYTVKGICNGEPVWAFYFKTDGKSGDYMIIETGDKSSSTQNIRDEWKEKAVAADEDYKITLKHKKGKDEVFLLSSFTKESFYVEYDDEAIVDGEGKNGITIKTADDIFLGNIADSSGVPEKAIYIVLIVIGITGFIVLFLFIGKKGFFNKEKRKEGVLDIRKIMEEETGDHADKEITATKLPDEDIAAFDRERKEEEIVDIKKYLQEKGFDTDYDSLTEDEKNKIMLELMVLRDMGKIDVKLYYKEASELWKK